MPEELFISVVNNETRVGVVAKGLLQELFLERSSSRSTVGNIYKGKILRILPGMQSAISSDSQSVLSSVAVTSKKLPGIQFTVGR